MKVTAIIVLILLLAGTGIVSFGPSKNHCERAQQLAADVRQCNAVQDCIITLEDWQNFQHAKEVVRECKQRKQS